MNFLVNTAVETNSLKPEYKRTFVNILNVTPTLLQVAYCGLNSFRLCPRISLFMFSLLSFSFDLEFLRVSSWPCVIFFNL